MRIFDLHCDTLDRLAFPLLPDDLRAGAGGHPVKGESGQLTDFARATGHLNLRNMQAFEWCQCFAVFVPDQLDVQQSRRFFELVAPTLARHAQEHPDMLSVVDDVAQVEDAFQKTRCVGLLTIEGGKLLAAAPDMVERIAQAGVKMVTLTWNGPNPLGSGHETHQGLTDLGRQRIAEMEDAHIVVDVSHLNDEGFEDVRRCARRPFAASHSNLRSVCDVPRNLTDDQFRAIRDAGGVVGLNYYVNFVVDDPELVARGTYSSDQLMAHVDRMLDLGGQDVVALGSDFDGCDIPIWLDSAKKLYVLVDTLRGRYGKELAEKICWRNAHDFFLRMG
jgi:membrane dipeptidase